MTDQLTDKPDRLGNSSIIIATTNAGKRREFSDLLAPIFDPQWKIYDRQSLPQSLAEVEETGQTFRENAIKKAMETAQATGCCALADDSGLEVEALGGAPGVHSARFAGDEATDAANNRLLIERLSARVGADRSARFRAVICLAMPDNAVARALLSRRGMAFSEVPEAAPRREGELVRVGDLLIVWFAGSLAGKIVDDPAGEGGFGYDPHFFVPSLGKTTAQMSGDEKNRISHRAAATQQLTRFFERPQ